MERGHREIALGQESSAAPGKLRKSRGGQGGGVGNGGKVQKESVHEWA